MSKISELVPASSLAELAKLDTEMQRSVAGMKQLLAESEKVNNSLKNQSVSYRELAGAISKANEVEKNMTAARRQQTNLLNELEKTGQKIIETSGKQVQAMERLRISIEKMGTSVKNSTDSSGSLKDLLHSIISPISLVNKGVEEVSKVKKLWNTVNKKLTTSLGITGKAATALQIGIVGLVIGGVMLAVNAYNDWNKKQKEAGQLNKDVNRSVQDEVIKISSLERILKDTNRATGDRLTALNELKNIMPQYNAHLSGEGELIEDNTGALKNYIEQLKNAAMAKIAADNAVKAEQNLTDWIDGLSEREKGVLLYGDNIEFMNSRGVAEEWSKQDKVLYTILSKQRKKQLEEINKWNDILDKTIISSIGAVKPKSGYDGFDAEKQAAKDLALYEIQSDAEKQQRIVQNTGLSFEERRKALDQFINYQVMAVNRSAANQLSAANLTDSQEKMIRRKANDEKIKIQEHYYQTLATLRAQEEEAIRKATEKEVKTLETKLQSRLREAASEESGEQSGLSSRFAGGGMKQEEYEKQKTDITVKYAKIRMEAEIASIREMMDIIGLTEEQKADMQKKLKDAELQYELYINEQKIKADEKTAARRIEIEEKLKEKREQLLGEIHTLMTTLINANFENQLKKLEKESEANQEFRDQEISRIEEQEQAGVISKEQAEAQKANIESIAQQREEEIQERKKQIQQQQARFEKANAALGIVVNTGLAIIKAFSTAGPIAGIPLAAMIGAVGAVQLATVLAQPIPEYAGGTPSHPGGLAIVGDGGRNELALLPSGKWFITPDHPTMVDLPKGTEVLPDITPLLAKETTRIPNRPEKSVQVNLDAQGIINAQKEVGRKIDRLSLDIQRAGGYSLYSYKASVSAKCINNFK